MITAPDEHRIRPAHWVILCAILLIASALRAYRIGGQSCWKDELFSFELSTGRGLGHESLPHDVIADSAPDLTSLQGAPAWHAIFDGMRHDTHPPLYPLLL